MRTTVYSRDKGRSPYVTVVAIDEDLGYRLEARIREAVTACLAEAGHAVDFATKPVATSKPWLLSLRGLFRPATN